MKQSDAFDILTMGHNVFLTGPAGSGKTFVLNRYIEFLKLRGAAVGVTASTGIAATHLGGITIHSWSGLGIRDALEEEELEAMLKRSYLKKRLRDTHALVIDEVSMLHPGQLDAVDAVCRAFRGSVKPFGGMQVIFSGDFFQLPPVRKRRERSEDGADEDGAAAKPPHPRFAYESDAWQGANIAVCHLDEQHRHEDAELVEVLNEIRGNAVSSESRARLAARMAAAGDESRARTKLYAHNADVDALNDRELEKIPGNATRYAMHTFGSPRLVDSLVKSCLAPETLSLKKGAAVMFVKNNFDAGFVNGTLGTVVGFDADGLPVVETRMGSLRRGTRPGGEKIVAEPMDWTIEENGVPLARVTQVPLRLAWAMTVHKSQGMSLDAAEIDLSHSFEPGMGYVALSRLRSLAGLHLRGLNETALQVDKEVLEKDKEFRDVSERMARRLGELSAAEKHKRREEFLARVTSPPGADAAKRAKEKDSTLDETKRLIEAGGAIASAARKRELTEGTILAHLEKLVALGKLSRADLAHLAPATETFSKIKDAFEQTGDRALSPVKKLLGDEFSYDNLRLVRLFLND